MYFSCYNEYIVLIFFSIFRNAEGLKKKKQNNITILLDSDHRVQVRKIIHIFKPFHKYEIRLL